MNSSSMPVGEWAFWALVGLITFSMVPQRAQFAALVVILLGALARMEMRRRGSSREFLSRVSGLSI